MSDHNAAAILHPDNGVINLDIDMKNLKVMSPLGRGAKGVVFLVEKGTGGMLALKAILRSAVENKKNGDGDDDVYRRIFFERQVLSSFQHPLLPKLHGVVSTDMIIGYVIDYCPGGDFNSLRNKQTEKMFSDDIIRFYSAELVLALEYLHGLGIVYRDLKPENVMIQENGHLMLVDFDLSNKLTPKTSRNTSPIHQSDQMPRNIKKKKNKFLEFFKCFSSEILKGDIVYPANRDSSVSSESQSVGKCNSFVGTDEYVSPEIIVGNGHDFAVDWWCLGVMMYEMLYGKTPFRGENRKETFYRILSKEPVLTGEPTPLRDLIKKLLEKDPNKRISVNEIKGHCFFKDVDWDFLLEMPRPPFIPEEFGVEGISGNNEIDVENYVKGVFEVKDGDNEKVENLNFIGEKKKGGNDEGYIRNNTNNMVRVQGLNPSTQTQDDNFLIF